MIKKITPEADIGQSALDFDLLNVDGERFNLQKSQGTNGLVVMFICNHCPYVMQILNQIVRDTKELQTHGINTVAIMPNDVILYPQDSFDNMKKLSRQKSFTFPYLIDTKQDTAHAYGAVCTPDFFGFNKDLKLKYRGRLIGNNGERELFDYMVNEDIGSQKVQYPSEGCSIKWSQE